LLRRRCLKTTDHRLCWTRILLDFPS
jgi:hypothetical protein